VDILGSQVEPRETKGIIRIIQITDCHLGPQIDYRLAGVRTLGSFEEVLARLGRQPQAPDLVMVSGDIAAHGSRDAYRHFSQRMVAAKLNYSWLPGNHDDFALMADIPAVPAYTPLLARGDWRIISLNTAVPHRVGGRLADAELEFLALALAEQANHPVVLFMHHPPMDVGCRWLDRQQVANGEALAAILRSSTNVKAIFTGHVHQQASLEFAGIPLYCTPSTCFQFAALQEDFALADLPPGYRWINLYDNGTIETGVVFIEDTEEKVDAGVKGY